MGHCWANSGITGRKSTCKTFFFLSLFSPYSFFIWDRQLLKTGKFILKYVIKTFISPKAAGFLGVISSIFISCLQKRVVPITESCTCRYTHLIFSLFMALECILVQPFNVELHFKQKCTSAHTPPPFFIDYRPIVWLN